MEKKKALAYLGGPRQLKDFIWYYLANGKEYQWSLICQPMYKEMKLKEVCEKSEIFDEIFMVDPYITESNIELAKTGIEMALYWMAGRSKQYALKEINKITNLNQYSKICLSTTRGVTPGMIALCANEIDVDIMEDGLGDNTDKNVRFEIQRLPESNYIVSYAFAKMGYFNIKGEFPLKSTKRCNRYSEDPEKLSKDLYKNVFQMNDMKVVDYEEYKSLLNKTFEMIDDLDNIEAVLFTSNMKDFTSNYKICNDLVTKYIAGQKYKAIAVKKHPRDLSLYNYKGINVREYDPMVPGEDFADKIENQDVYFMFPSTMLLQFRALGSGGGKIHIFHFRNLQRNVAYQNGFEWSLQELNKDGKIKINILDI